MVKGYHGEGLLGRDAGKLIMAKTVEDHDSKQEPRLFTQGNLDAVSKERDNFMRLWQEADDEITLLKGANADVLARLNEAKKELKAMDENYKKLEIENMINSQRVNAATVGN